ncbi:molybdopterin molybdotransferase MoeA [Winogradskyella bathintestinalis]|uniref:Molybdopterin molybdenumtransferase n=1 Tax=Winogradskyella bathintestinalis TaxID=3035208 RepID=A0ABT7ZSF9_9FLAO|nr:gephyrin-like molybdotransferase Glp [Winogradskyella bathintestinalis]MDN3491891.1 molybdopterin molybdotransferase MoeA [Winogradskyella bathintestinalis]
MISVDKALHIIKSFPKEYTFETVELRNALNLVLFEDIFSPINMPPFRQSAMDGYAFRYSENQKFTIVEESKAGDGHNYVLNEGEAVRIFTGALVPDNADTVIMQEHVEREGEIIQIKKMPFQFANIRKVGEQINIGELALKKGTQLNEAAIGFLAGLGITTISVYKTPKVAILVTGNELQKPGTKLELGRIYESNSIMLEAALKSIGVKDIELIRVKDNYNSIKNRIKKTLSTKDILLISGGISVGDYDFVREALLENEVEELFYKVNQKPGKPLWFGKKANTYVFALPGNPASALTCFYIYARPLLKKISGCKNNYLQKVKVISKTVINNSSGKTLFLKAHLEGNSVEVLQGQSSAMLYTYALSNALICVDSETTEIKIGDEVECIKLVL